MLLALLGGALIGLSASLAHAGARDTVGVSGHVGGLLRWPWRRLDFGDWFVVGLIAGGFLIARVAPASALTGLGPRPLLLLVVSGLLVGFGTRLGSGCTSGHGVCGISRLSRRSIVATGVFMATAALVVLLTRHGLAGWRPG
jgi:uncharacterized membrane protein YedE/YeeE